MKKDLADRKAKLAFQKAHFGERSGMEDTLGAFTAVTGGDGDSQEAEKLRDARERGEMKDTTDAIMRLEAVMTKIATGKISVHVASTDVPHPSTRVKAPPQSSGNTPAGGEPHR